MENQINEAMVANVTDEYALRVVDRALAPDVRDPVSPRKLLIVGVGIVSGLAIGLFLVWFFSDLPELPRKPVTRAGLEGLSAGREPYT
jgi:uncharacterized protein involved in exopolysaccharide biosynthesis